MATGWTRRLASAPHALAIAGTGLALAALGQAVARAVMLSAFRAGQAPGSTAGEAVSLCLLALAITVPLIFLRPAAAAAAITAASTVSLTVFGSGALTVAGFAAQVIASYRLGFEGFSRDARLAGGDRRDRTQVLACVLAVPFLVLALDGRARVAAILLAAVVPAAVWAGIAQRARGEAARQATAREVLAGTLADHMARGERARIARELHDVVAHYISMIAVQAETARETTPGLPAAGAQRLAEIAGTARAGLTEMRRLLGVLRTDAGGAAARHPQPGLPQLAELIDAARETSGAGARLIVSGPVAAFDPGIELAAYRIAQEALTNARRHAPGAAVDVELRYGDDTLLLRIRDNGPGPPAGYPASGNGHDAAGSPGHGLAGMRERATAAGGSLRTAAAPGGGFLVEATLPAKPEFS
jgi:signal transduction histidine kinase